ncbi:MAG: hypothetical protein OES24_11185 [Acidimicrobiia bacterium]|nr:hypothetical protein [Acidimicrobiia bacterium]
MAKRIVSGIFILTALGALGVILAGAMTSGEQLIVRFLTAVTVAALALYVISDLRLQNEQEEPRTERNTSGAERSTTQATAVMATVTASRRRERLTRRGRQAPTPPTPNFEAIEPVTTRSRTVPLTDPTEAVTGSRLVPPAPDQVERVVPPHPMAGRRVEKPTGQPGRPASAIETNPPIQSNPPLPAGVPSRDSAEDVVDLVAETVTGPVDASPEFLTPPDERAQESSTGSVIANRSFTYSGRLHSFGADWPPTPPAGEEAGEPAERGLEHVDAAEMSAVDAQTAELPAITGLPTRDTDDDLLAGLFISEFDNTEDPLAKPAYPPRPEAYLFAVDTAELLLMEQADIDRDMESTWPMAGDPPAPTKPSFRQIEAAQYAAPPRPDYLDLRDTNDLVTYDEVARPLPAEPSPGSPTPEKLTAAIRSGEIQVINSLISQGMLSTSGPITDRDVRTMVYVAFTSNELRKLILAGGTPDGIRAGDLDLGDVELFDESRFAPPPKRLYAGPPTVPDKAPEPVLDLVALEAESALGSPVPPSEPDLDAELVPRMPTPRHLYRRADADRVDQ